MEYEEFAIALGNALNHSLAAAVAVFLLAFDYLTWKFTTSHTDFEMYRVSCNRPNCACFPMILLIVT